MAIITNWKSWYDVEKPKKDLYIMIKKRIAHILASTSLSNSKKKNQNLAK
jgi:hypothetical protein